MKRYCVVIFGILMLSACVVTRAQEPDYRTLVAETLTRMNDAYGHKNIPAFFGYIASDTTFDRDAFALSVENDFAGFVTVEYETDIQELRHYKKEGDVNETVVVKVAFSRSAFTYRYGTSVDMGETVLTFDLMPDKTVLLKGMDEPHLYGLITP